MAMLNVDDFAATASLFPIKLYRMVCDSQCQCMNWGGEGEHLVLNTRLFEDELLQQTLARWKYQLKTTSTTSFIRQLHAYGFRKVVEGFGEPNNIRRYYHPYFHRNRPDLLMYMKRSIRSSNPKKVPIRIYEDANKQPVLMTSMFNHPMHAFEKMNHFNFEANSPQANKAEESGPSLAESSNKRRRKAPPKKHPSFEESCDWDVDEGEYSSPTMVARAQHLKERQLQVFSAMGNMRYGNQPLAMIKHEAITMPRSYPSDSKLGPSFIQELPDSEARKSSDRSGAGNSEPGKSPIDSARSLEMDSSAASKPDCDADAEFSRARGGSVDDDEMESDEPLDLSHSAKRPVGLIAGTQGLLATSRPLPVHSDEPGAGNLVMFDGARCRSQYDQGIASQPRPCNPSCHPSFKSFAPRNISRSLPSFPAATGNRFNIPPNSVLQPAYIAWPTRGIFCPQTKQWIQARPTIIPLPFKNQNETQAPGNSAPGGFKFAGENGPQMNWNFSEAAKRDMKEGSNKADAAPSSDDGIAFSPMLRNRSVSEM